MVAELLPLLVVVVPLFAVLVVAVEVNVSSLFGRVVAGRAVVVALDTDVVERMGTEVHIWSVVDEE